MCNAEVWRLNLCSKFQKVLLRLVKAPHVLINSCDNLMLSGEDYKEILIPMWDFMAILVKALLGIK